MSLDAQAMGRCTLLAGLGLLAACTGPSKDEQLSQPSGLSPARSYPYEVQMKGTGTVGGKAESTEFAFDLAGQLEVTPIEVSATHVKVVLEFAHAKLSGSDDPKAKQRFERIARELEQPSVISYAHGAMIEAQFGKNLEALTIGILRNLGAALQLPSASSAPGEITAKEYDATGRYVAEYKRGATANSYAKRKLAYEALITDAALQTSIFGQKVPPPKIHESRAELQLDEGRLVRFNGFERLELPLVAGSAVTSQTTISLAAGADRAAGKLDPVALAQLNRLPAAEPYRTATASFDFNAIKIGGRGFDELLSMLESLATRRELLQPTDRRGPDDVEPERKQERTRWTGEQTRTLTAMATLLRTEPELTDRALVAIRAKSPAHHVLVTALGMAGVERSQQALLELMADATLSEEDRNAAGLALIRTKAPADASVRALEGLVDDRSWHQYAILGLGTYCRIFRETGRMDAHKRLGELLVARLRASTTAAVREETLSALSNSGYAGMLKALPSYLDDSDHRTREQAMRALRLVQHPDVEGIAVTKLADAAPGVRLAALEAAKHLSPSDRIAMAVQQEALHDDDANVRLSALRLLISWKDRVPTVRATIEQVAAGDPSQPIRQVAQRAIAAQG